MHTATSTAQAHSGLARRLAAAVGPPGAESWAELLRRGLLGVQEVYHLARSADPMGRVSELFLEPRHRALSARDSIGPASTSADCLHRHEHM